ncbi:MAG: hypothetical protein NVSMB52_09770 [Chloroflexota bacterium]
MVPESTIRLLGVRIDCLRRRELLDLAQNAVAQNSKTIVLYVNVHCMNIRNHDAEYAAILEASDVVYCDGTGVRLGARLAGRTIPERMTGADWIDDLCRTAVRHNLSLFFIGGVHGAASDAAKTLCIKHPGLKIVGLASGYSLGTSTVNAINSSGTSILLVGMGTPTQEKWIFANAPALEVPVIWAVGALFDFISGRIPRGPHWLTEYGFEWLCRLVVEPRKLWRRYLLGNPAFMWRIVRRYWLHLP